MPCGIGVNGQRTDARIARWTTQKHCTLYLLLFAKT